MPPDHIELQLGHLKTKEKTNDANTKWINGLDIDWKGGNEMKNLKLPSANLLYGGSLWHAFAAFITSNSTQYLKLEIKTYRWETKIKTFDV